jgi:geranylgeranyl diphosphate synthase, type I
MDQWLHTQSHNAPSLEPLLRLLKTSLFGGKKLRGMLVKLGYEIVAPAPSPHILQPAAAYEILHAGLLIHDDILDKSLLRREKPTLYRELGGDHYGISQALCLGDMTFFLATAVLARSEFPAESKNRALTLLSDTIMNTVTGQMLDVKLSQPSAEKHESEVHTIYKLKTAAYSVSGPLTLGGTLAGADAQVLAAMQQFGEAAGAAFQIQDDILGVFGDETVTGKSATSDIEENKNTLLIAYALKNATQSQKHTIERYYGRPELSRAGHEAVKQVFEDCGALDYARRTAADYAHSSRTFIPLIAAKPNQQAVLEGFVDYMISRQK